MIEIKSYEGRLGEFMNAATLRSPIKGLKPFGRMMHKIESPEIKSGSKLEGLVAQTAHFFLELNK